MPQTGVAIIDWFLAALDAWGYLIVFGFTVFENLFVVGSFTPGETVVIAAAVVASRGMLNIWLVGVASLVGTIVGSNISYWAGRRAGLEAVRDFVRRVADTPIGRLVRIDDSGLDEVHAHFHTHGAKTVFISRFAMGVKNFVPAVAGATRMPVFWFELYTFLSAIAYTTIMCTIGWFLGANLDIALRVASGIGWFGLTILAVFVVVLYFARRRLRRGPRGSTGESADEADE